MPLTPEQQAREEIDQMLDSSGWILQDVQDFNPTSGLGVAVREFRTTTGPADYLLFVNKEPVGVIEAKKKGVPLSLVEEQTARYSTSGFKFLNQDTPLRFAYESTAAETHFTDYEDPKYRAREVFDFHKPETLAEWLKKPDTFRQRLTQIPLFENPDNRFRACQERAIVNLEASFADNRPKALIQMATGAGKTYTAVTSIYRLLKFAKAKRVLFLVDTRNLGEQAEQEFQAYTPVDDQRKFTELYNVQRLSSNFIDPASQVCISTIQRMYSILRGEEEMDEEAESTSLYEIKQTGRTKEVAYNPDVPIEMFDMIIIDECHRSIYNLWKQVLDYFDAFLVGLTATPDSRTFAFFHQNVVSEYPHEQAVADGVNVGFDVYLIETEISKEGGHIEARQFVDKRSRDTRQKRWERLDEDVDYSGKQLDRDVVNPSQIRTIIRTFKEKIQTEIFVNRQEVPKTLIFAKTDSHADDIIQIVREEFNEGNEFCKKVTYGNKEEKPSSVLQQFRTAYNPRIAVTVDMIATGIDIRPLECLLFMRDVKSRNYFEQMKGRGTRVLDEDDLRKVTPSAHSNKTHFVIIDAVGVTKSLKTDSRPLERKPTIPLKDLMLGVVMGAKDEDTLTSLANRLARLNKQVTEDEKEQFTDLAGGCSISRVTTELLDAYNPERQKEKVKEMFKEEIEKGDLTPDHEEQAKQKLVEEATEVFNHPDLRKFIEDVRRSHDQIIDEVNLDRVIEVGWDSEGEDKAEEILQSFRKFLEENKDEVTALQIYYDQPYRRRELTFQMIKELNEALAKPPYNLATDLIWQAYARVDQNKVKGASEKKMLTDIVSLVRYELKIDQELAPYADVVNSNFKEWVFRKNAGPIQFTEEQMTWLRMIKDHIVSSVHFTKEDLDYAPFDAQGGIGGMHQVFGNEMEGIIEEINEELAA